MPKYILGMSTIFKLSSFLAILAFLFMGFTNPSVETPFFSESKISIINDLQLLKNEKIVYISLKDQRLYIIYKKKLLKEFDISSSKYGIGFEEGSLKTPVGLHHIKSKIGDEVPINGIFKYRKYSGELSVPNHPNYVNKDLITTRILRLSGSTSENKASYHRCIYIHGTPEEDRIGEPSSHGCIRMRNIDVYALYEFVEKGTPVLIR